MRTEDSSIYNLYDITRLSKINVLYKFDKEMIYKASRRRCRIQKSKGDGINNMSSERRL